jgi:hypothetical protein
MKFSDLTEFDLEVIRSMANRKLIDRAGWNPSKVLMETVFEFIHAKGMNIVKDPNREPTMEGPKASWYQAANAKKPWSY